MTAPWPDLPYPEAKDTYLTLHLWTQILGKIKLQRLPWINHGWHVALQVTPGGITTGSIPDRETHFQIDIDLIRHRLVVSCSHGPVREFPLADMPVADFYRNLFGLLEDLGIRIRINKKPNEIADGIPFDKDTEHHVYNPAQAESLHKALLNVQEVLTEFRAGFKGKCSPIHLFWGSFDLAVSRFSGRPAPLHPGGVTALPDRVAQEAYSHEVSSCGFWPGSEAFPQAAFYAYLYPEPAGYADARVQPKEAYYDTGLREFILPYEAVRLAADPRQALLQFLETTYATGADLARWDRPALEGTTAAPPSR